MTQDVKGDAVADTKLTDDERKELEALRAEKQARQEQAERLELERLRAQKAQTEADAKANKKIAERRERGRKFMQPDEDDLSMGTGQKLVFVAIILIALAVVLVTLLGGMKP